MVRQAHALDGQRVLDVGCGVGMYTAAFARSGARPSASSSRPIAPARRTRRSPDRAVGRRDAPFADHAFDVVFSHEVLEHVRDDRLCAAEMVRVTRPGGAIVIFVPNRLYFFETHGIYWRGTYCFGNIPLVNWLPDRLRDRLAPHVRAYTRRGLRRLFAGLPCGRCATRSSTPAMTTSWPAGRSLARAPGRHLRVGAHAPADPGAVALPGSAVTA